MAYLGSIFWVLANRSVATVANCDVVFCTFDCLCGRDFCMTCTHTCADVHVLAWHRRSEVAREPFFIIIWARALQVTYAFRWSVFISEIGALPVTFARIMSIAHTPGSLHIQWPMRCQWAAIVVCFLRISLWPLMYWLMSFLEIATRV